MDQQMTDPRRRFRMPQVRVLAAPAEDLTADLLRLAASGVALAVAVFLTLVR
jgi:hypothetical protein